LPFTPTTCCNTCTWKALLANASHELRPPLTRIRLAMELMKDRVDARLRVGLEQDIGELDQLVDEILLASRLDAVTQTVANEEIDLLALAAEECARYDEAVLEGVEMREGRGCFVITLPEG
jgi:signal transduction histidine kinase